MLKLQRALLTKEYDFYITFDNLKFVNRGGLTRGTFTLLPSLSNQLHGMTLIKFILSKNMLKLVKNVIKCRLYLPCNKKYDLTLHQEKF